MAETISQAAIDLIVDAEVTGESAYNRLYRAPTWPQGQSGVTIGIGYDVGYVTATELHDDWDGKISDLMVAALESRALGIQGPLAGHRARELRSIVDVPWDAAMAVFQNHDIPKWIARVNVALQNINLLSPDSLGAIVSLAYNRGTSFSMVGDRYREMRAIKADMTAKNFADIPAQFRSMKRLWAGTSVAGLVTRREAEAVLFEKGLIPVQLSPAVDGGAGGADLTLPAGNVSQEQIA